MTLSDHIMSFSSHCWRKSSISRRTTWKTRAAPKLSTNRKTNLSIPSKRCVHIYTDFISISVKTGGTSSSIPHRLNNSSRSTSLLHIKKQCTTWVFEWAVERKQPVSCQGEHPEIISIIYRTDILQRGVRQGTISAWRLHLKRWKISPGTVWCCILISSVGANCTRKIVFSGAVGCKTSSFKGV